MKFNGQFFNAFYEQDFHFLALEQELPVTAFCPISPVFYEKNHNFSVASSQGNACYAFAKTVPTAACLDTSFGGMLFQICEGQLKIKSQP